MIKIALPKGQLMNETADLLEAAGWDLSDYSKNARLYRLTAGRFPQAQIKILQDKDIPIQVSVGNYDIGICSLEWINELLSGYPSSSLVRLKSLGYGRNALYAAAAPDSAFNDISDLYRIGGNIRIASEYPNIAQEVAATLRLKRFTVYPVWGGAEGYPPDDADIVVLPAADDSEVRRKGLKPLKRVLESEAILVANRESLRNKDLADVISSVSPRARTCSSTKQPAVISVDAVCQPSGDAETGLVRLALPDGHQQVHVRKILDKAGIIIEDYPSTTGNRRPKSNLEQVSIKVIRPQDMPLQVANGSFDAAITGRDWLLDHLYRFPTSPLVELLDLKYGKVRIVAVIDGNLAFDDTGQLRRARKKGDPVYRIATEYINIADRYAQECRLGRYCIIPTWGATEAFIPEDADMLIENTETGGTIARHNLKIIETLFISTACVIGRRVDSMKPEKQAVIDNIVELLKRGLEEI